MDRQRAGEEDEVRERVRQTEKYSVSVGETLRPSTENVSVGEAQRLTV